MHSWLSCLGESLFCDAARPESIRLAVTIIYQHMENAGRPNNRHYLILACVDCGRPRVLQAVDSLPLTPSSFSLFFLSNSDGLKPRSDGLQPTRPSSRMLCLALRLSAKETRAPCCFEQTKRVVLGESGMVHKRQIKMFVWEEKQENPPRPKTMKKLCPCQSKTCTCPL